MTAVPGVLLDQVGCDEACAHLLAVDLPGRCAAPRSPRATVQDRPITTFGRLRGAAMTGPQVDYAAVFRDLPIPVLLLTPEFVIEDMNRAYLAVAGRTREELLGRNVFDAFPDNPEDPGATGVRELSASLGRVLATGQPDALSMQKYDVEVPGKPGVFAPRYWCPVHAPVLGPDGDVVLIVQCVEEITERVRKFIGGLAAGDARGA